MARGWQRVGVVMLVSVTLAGTWGLTSWAQDEVDRYWSQATQEAREARQQPDSQTVKSQERGVSAGESMTAAQSVKADRHQTIPASLTGGSVPQDAPMATSLTGRVEMPHDQPATPYDRQHAFTQGEGQTQGGQAMGPGGMSAMSQDPQASPQPMGEGAHLKDAAMQMMGTMGQAGSAAPQMGQSEPRAMTQERPSGQQESQAGQSDRQALTQGAGAGQVERSMGGGMLDGGIGMQGVSQDRQGSPSQPGGQAGGADSVRGAGAQSMPTGLAGMSQNSQATQPSMGSVGMSGERAMSTGQAGSGAPMSATGSSMGTMGSQSLQGHAEPLTQGLQQSLRSAGDGGSESRQIFGPLPGDVGTSGFGMTGERGSPRGAAEPATGMSEQLQRLGVMGTGGVQTDRSGAPQQNTLSVPSDVQNLLKGSQTGTPAMRGGGQGVSGDSWTRNVQAGHSTLMGSQPGSGGTPTGATAMQAGGGHMRQDAGTHSQNPSGSMSAQNVSGPMGSVSTAGAEVRQVAAPSSGGPGSGPGGPGGGGHR